MNATKITIEQMKAMQRELVGQGFQHSGTVLCDDRTKSGIYYSHPDGREASIRMGGIHYTPARATEGGAA